MRWVDAGLISAKVIGNQSVWYSAIKVLVYDPVSFAFMKNAVTLEI